MLSKLERPKRAVEGGQADEGEEQTAQEEVAAVLIHCQMAAKIKKRQSNRA